MKFTRVRLPILVGMLVLGAVTAGAQSPFLFATQPVSRGARLTAAVDAGYNNRAFEPVAGERLEPRATINAVLSPLLAVQGQLGVASTLDHQTRLADQLELMVSPIRTGGFAFGAAAGVRHEYSGTNVGLARIVAGRTTERSALAADVLIEHPFAKGRDAVDVVTTVGVSRALAQRVWVGIEAVGSDLEGFWNSAEAEGGATLLVGPTVSISLSDRWRFVVGGGPVLRATTDRAPDGLSAPVGGPMRAGYVLRSSLRRAW